MKRDEVQTNEEEWPLLFCKIIYLFQIMCCVHINAICVGVPKEARDIRPLGIGVVDSCNLHDVDVGKQT